MPSGDSLESDAASLTSCAALLPKGETCREPPPSEGEAPELARETAVENTDRQQLVPDRNIWSPTALGAPFGAP